MTNRLKEIREKLSLTQLDMANVIGISRSTYTGIEKGKASLTERNKMSIIDKLNINLQWLETGEGNMLKDAITQTSDLAITDPTIMKVPLVNQYAYAGYLSSYNDVTYMDHLPTIPFIVDHEGMGHYVAFEVKGDSMDDGSIESYIDGDKLLCREIMPHLWTCAPLHIQKWDFVIVHREGILIKRILKHDVEGHKILIHSLNPYYEDREIDLQDVKQIFNVIEIQRNKRR